MPCNPRGGRRGWGETNTNRCGFDGDVPAEALKTIAALPGPSEVVSDDFIPKAEWDEAVAAVHADVTDELDTQSVSVDLAQADRTFEVTIDTSESSPAVSSHAADQVENEVNDSLRKQGFSTDGHDLKITEEDASGELTDGFARGGGYLNISPSSAGATCTAGFIIRSSVGHRIGTAGHCALAGDRASYRLHGSEGGAGTAVYRSWGTFNPNTSTAQFDYGAYTTGSWSGYPSFYYNPGQKRMVSGAASRRYDKGVSVCFFGRTTYDNASCGVVASPVATVYFASDGVTVRGLTGFSKTTRGGDSGGPVFRARWAVGTVTGTKAGKGYFTPVHLFKDRGWSVWVA